MRAAFQCGGVPYGFWHNRVTPAKGGPDGNGTVNTPESLSILIVTYNAEAVLHGCLDSVFANAPGCEFEVICADNASTDGTRALVRDRYPWVRLVPSERNLGFAGGNALAAEHASGDVLLLLNPDTVVLPGAIDELTSVLLADERIAIAGACLADADGTPATSWGDFPTVGWAVANTAPWSGAGLRVRSRVRMDGTCAGLGGVTPVDWVSGAALAIRRSTWDALGGMDPDFFLYYEETDLCARAKAAGGEVVTVPAARVVHLEGAIVGVQSVRQYVWSTRSLIRFLARNRGAFQAAFVRHWVAEVNAVLWLASVVAGFWSPRLRERRPRYAALVRVGLGMRTGFEPGGDSA